jgi:hypothetical protein
MDGGGMEKIMGILHKGLCSLLTATDAVQQFREHIAVLPL